MPATAVPTSFITFTTSALKAIPLKYQMADGQITLKSTIYYVACETQSFKTSVTQSQQNLYIADVKDTTYSRANNQEMPAHKPEYIQYMYI